MRNEILQLERECLAGLLEQPRQLPMYIKKIGHHHNEAWTCREHKEIASAITTLYKQGIMPDYSTVIRYFPAMQEQLKTLHDNTPAPCIMILENRIIELAREAYARQANKCLAEIKTATDATLHRINFEDFTEIVLSAHINIPPAEKTGVNFGEISTDIYEKLLERRKNPGVSGLKTGYSFIDSIFSGLQYGKINIIGARPSHGKTAIALNVALNVALGYSLTEQLATGVIINPSEIKINKEESRPVIIYSHDMDHEELYIRAISIIAQINGTYLAEGRLNEKTWNRVTAAVQIMRELPISIEDSAEMFIANNATNDFQYKAAKSEKAGLVIIDYIQKESLAEEVFSKTVEIGEISKLWENALKKTRWASVILAQLNREADGVTPKISHLRDCGQIEQDAYTVTLLYRPGHENSDIQFSKTNLDICKNRGGRLANPVLHFTGSTQTFRPWCEDDDRENITKNEIEQHNWSSCKSQLNQESYNELKPNGEQF